MTLANLKKVLWDYHQIIVWVLWLAVGTLFYWQMNGEGLVLGFYMAVSTGYAAGFGFPLDRNDGVLMFSCLYILSGSILISSLLFELAHSMVAEKSSWYDRAIEQEAEIHQTNWFTPINRWHKKNFSKLIFVYMWLTFFTIGWVIAYLANDDLDALQSFFMTMSYLSSTGTLTINPDSSNLYFVFAGCYAAVGIPLMALSMSNLAAVVKSLLEGGEQGLENQKKQIINQNISRLELEMMLKFGLDDGDGNIEIGEFIVLCAVRLGALDPKLVTIITKRFAQLDSDGSGHLSYEEILDADSKEAYVRESFEHSLSKSNLSEHALLRDIEIAADEKKSEDVVKVDNHSDQNIMYPAK